MMDLCFVDVETTGLDPVRHELLELAAVRVDRHTLEPLDHVSVKVRPERLADADPKALEVNGYSDDAWRDAVSLGTNERNPPLNPSREAEPTREVDVPEPLLVDRDRLVRR